MHARAAAMVLAFGRRVHALATAIGIALLTVCGVFAEGPESISVEHVGVALLWAAVLGTRLLGREGSALGFGRERSSDDGAADSGPARWSWRALEASTLVVVGVHAVLSLMGGWESTLRPLVYVTIALVVATTPRAVAITVVASDLALEGALYFVTEGRADVPPFALHAAIVVGSAALHAVVTAVEVARIRARSKRELEASRQRLSEDARSFRLIAAPSAEPRGRDDERAWRASVEEVQKGLYWTLDLLKRSLDAHTCTLLWRDESAEGDKLRIAELATDSDDVADGPFDAGAGAVGPAASRGLVVNITPRLGYGGICFYRSPARVQAFLAVPVEEPGPEPATANGDKSPRPATPGVLRGALCVDRLDARPFTPREEELVRSAAAYALHTLENERVFLALEESKREQALLYRASQSLGAALNEEQVIEASLRAAAEIAPHDFAAITLYDPQTRKHTVRHAVGERSETVRGLTFGDNASLTAMAVKNRHYLPYRGEFDPTQQTVFTRRATLQSMQSLLILPLVVHQDAVGTLTLAARRREAFGSAARTTLQVLANQVAGSLMNARMVRRLEELATQDGLTGCLNKRAFLDELDKRVRSAERFGKKLSLIVTDLDHFKAVNDTYGHATGDIVIKKLGEVLQRAKRETDVVARFGGEEFCILCEETDTSGATLLAERVREEMGKAVIQTEIGALSVTCSLGVATMPEHAGDRNALFEAADQALYAAKRSGRNKTCSPVSKTTPPVRPVGRAA